MELTEDDASAVSVCLILELNIGDALHAWAARMPVWLVGSAANRRLAEIIREESPKLSVTIFERGSSTSPVAEDLEIVGIIDQHATEYSAEIIFDTLYVLGVSCGERVKDVLGAFRFDDFEVKPYGFVARRARAQVHGD